MASYYIRKAGDKVPAPEEFTQILADESKLQERIIALHHICPVLNDKQGWNNPEKLKEWNNIKTPDWLPRENHPKLEVVFVVWEGNEEKEYPLLSRGSTVNSYISEVGGSLMFVVRQKK